MQPGRIHSVELLELALQVSVRLGYRVQEDMLEGFPGGACHFKGNKWLVVDPSQPCRERLQIVLDALAGDPDLALVKVPPVLTRAIKRRSAA